MTTTYPFKRGDTFRLAIVYSDDNDEPVDVTAYTITCHVRKWSGDALVAECVFAAVDLGEGSFTFTVAAALTALWDLGEHYFDLRYVDADGIVVHSETQRFIVEREATRP